MSNDKRRDPRFETNQQLWCEGQGQRAEARNVSRSGMFIVGEEPREVGAQFKVSFDDEEAGSIELKMEVMWCDRPAGDGQAGIGMGVRIVGFDRGEDAYERFLTRQGEAQADGTAKRGKSKGK